MSNLNFKNGNPGAVLFGNFINYYQFHSCEERTQLLPSNLFFKEEKIIALDIGCNAGVKLLIN